MMRKFQLRLSVTQCVVMCLNVSLSLFVPHTVNCLEGILGVSNGNFTGLSVTPLLFFFLFLFQDLQNAAVLILANKQDVKGSLTAAEISQILTLESITTHSWHVQACCALTGEG